MKGNSTRCMATFTFPFDSVYRIHLIKSNFPLFQCSADVSEEGWVKLFCVTLLCLLFISIQNKYCFSPKTTNRESFSHFSFSLFATLQKWAGVKLELQIFSLLFCYRCWTEKGSKILRHLNLCDTTPPQHPRKAELVRIVIIFFILCWLLCILMQYRWLA